MELKGAVKMTVDYSDGTQTVVNYNPVSGEPTGDPVEQIVVDQAILDENPVLADAGVEVGDIGVVVSEEEAMTLGVDTVTKAS